MAIIKEILVDFGLEIIMLIAVTLAGILGKQFKLVFEKLKPIVEKWFDTKEKKEAWDIACGIGRTVVKYVEQKFTDIHGEDKLNAALERFAEILTEKGIDIPIADMKTIIEAAVCEFNNGFNKESNMKLPDENTETVT